MPQPSLGFRLLTLLVVLAVLAGIDRWRHGVQATRWRAYLFLLGAATGGGLVGLLNDQLTLYLSPEYFTVGKGIPAGSGLRAGVSLLGFHAGFLAGALASGLLLWANGRRPLSLTYGALLQRLLRGPLLGAVVLAPACGGLSWVADPAGIGSGLATLLPEGRISAFLLVWGIHAGLYAGALVGTLWALWSLRQRPPS